MASNYKSSKLHSATMVLLLRQALCLSTIILIRSFVITFWLALPFKENYNKHDCC